MKILAIQNFMHQRAAGGAELLCHDLFTGLARLGHRVDVLTAGPEEYEEQYHIEPALASIPRTSHRRKLRTPLAKLRWLRVARRNHHAVKAAIARHQPDVVYVHNTEWTTLAPLAAAIGSGIRTVVHCHNHQYGDYWIKDRKAPSLVQRLFFNDPALERASLIAVSRSVARPLAGNGFPSDRLRVVHNGLPDEVLDGPCDGPRERKALFVGAVSRHKGVHVALEAVALLRDEGIALPLEIVGAGSSTRYQAQLFLFAKRKKFAGAVTYVGTLLRRNTWERMRAAEMVLVPSLCAEAFGLVAVEAMACGALPVVSDRGALPEVVGDHGLVAEPTARGFADAIKRAIALPPEERRRRRQAAHQFAGTAYRIEETVAQVEKVLAGG
ncbi:MAG: glycosyltransferase family 4 protein [Candidatus Edwardsbacteria bacterium]|nr:glycosyltransferase family 4 protein [Candidatus Edwardsbacteria bacterium]